MIATEMTLRERARIAAVLRQVEIAREQAEMAERNEHERVAEAYVQATKTCHALEAIGVDAEPTPGEATVTVEGITFDSEWSYGVYKLFLPEVKCPRCGQVGPSERFVDLGGLDFALTHIAGHDRYWCDCEIARQAEEVIPQSEMDGDVDEHLTAADRLYLAVAAVVREEVRDD